MQLCILLIVDSRDELKLLKSVFNVNYVLEVETNFEKTNIENKRMNFK